MKKSPNRKKLWKPIALILLAMAVDIALIAGSWREEAVIPKKPEFVLVVQSLEEV